MWNLKDSCESSQRPRYLNSSVLTSAVPSRKLIHQLVLTGKELGRVQNNMVYDFFLIY